MAHAERAADALVIANTKGYADPDGPIAHTTQKPTAETFVRITAGLDCL